MDRQERQTTCASFHRAAILAAPSGLALGNDDVVGRESGLPAGCWAAFVASDATQLMVFHHN
jgi:hypothetical protein